MVLFQSEKGKFLVFKGYYFSASWSSWLSAMAMAYIINPMNTEPALRSIYTHCPAEKKQTTNIKDKVEK